MINTSSFFEILQKNHVDFFSGVPDSLLSDICGFINDNVNARQHIIAANEGNAVAHAVGYYLATNKIPLVYLQNSGFGNMINPILSITDDKVYAIPMIVLMGWRGEPNTKDEPQHIRQGEINEDLLNALKIPYNILDKKSDYASIVEESISTSLKLMKPFVILVRTNTFEKYKLAEVNTIQFPLVREDAVKQIVNSLTAEDIVVSTTGKTSRELYEYREFLGQSHEKDFLTVGGMGHTSSIALGIALAKTDRNIYCIDGDGSVIMHMGSLAINGQIKDLTNFKHIIINNGAHDSVGGQPTVGFKVSFVEIAKACGYSFAKVASEINEIDEGLSELSRHKGCGLLEIRVNKGARENLGRPKSTPTENKEAFQKFIL